jgi:hypothetical protein
MDVVSLKAQGPKTYGLKIKLRYFLILLEELDLARYSRLWGFPKSSPDWGGFLNEYFLKCCFYIFVPPCNISNRNPHAN